MKTLIIQTLLIFSIIGNSAYAQEVISLDKGSPAPFKCYLFTEEKANSVKTQLIEYDKLKELEISYKKSIDLYKSNEDLYQHKINILLDQNGKLIESISKTNEVDKFENRLWFILGMAVTGIAVYGAGQLK